MPAAPNSSVAMAAGDLMAHSHRCHPFRPAQFATEAFSVPVAFCDAASDSSSLFTLMDASGQFGLIPSTNLDISASLLLNLF